jgi:hypothetical protein
VTEQELFEQKQTETTKKFWDEARIRAAELGVLPEDMQLAGLQICGMPPWTAMQRLLLNGTYGGRIEVENLEPEDIQELRKMAETILNAEATVQLKNWMRKRSEELYVLDLQEYDWKRKDSEIELRFLIDMSKQTLAKTKTISQTLANTILNAVRELNQMYKFTGSSFDVSKAKAVLFVGEDQLED